LASGSEIAANVVQGTAAAFVTVAITSISPGVAFTPVAPILVVAILTVAGFVVLILGAFAKAATTEFGPVFPVIFAASGKWFVVGA
jgi:hypothetical protein